MPRTAGPVRGTSGHRAEILQAGKGQVGLDHDQIRGWIGWHRSITVA